VKSTAVRFWDVRRNKSSKRISYEVRWVVAGRQKSRTRATKALADSLLSDLRQAARRGEAFDAESGLPESMLVRGAGASWLDFAQAYVDAKWPHAAAKSRDGTTEALATATPALTLDLPGRPDAQAIRRALRHHLLPPDARDRFRPPDVEVACRWLAAASLPLAELADASTVRLGLDALALKLDAKAAAATTVSRKRAVFYNALQYAVELGLLPSNPLDTIRWKPAKVAETVDPRVVINPRQAQELLTAVTYVGRRGRGRRLMAMYACMYYAGLRPGEAIALRDADCHLPSHGWGRLALTTSRPEVNTRWTDTGSAHEERRLKHRAQRDVRPVPIPPVLVSILREHMAEFGPGPDGRLFRSERGGVVASTAYGDVWAQARTLAFTPAQVASPMARRPYDLRHAAVSLWLNAGVPATEVAARAGHSVEVLLRVYAKCVDGQVATVNKRIDEALGDWA